MKLARVAHRTVFARRLSCRAINPPAALFGGFSPQIVGNIGIRELSGGRYGNFLRLTATIADTKPVVNGRRRIP